VGKGGNDQTYGDAGEEEKGTWKALKKEIRSRPRPRVDVPLSNGKGQPGGIFQRGKRGRGLSAASKKGVLVLQLGVKKRRADRSKSNRKNFKPITRRAGAVIRQSASKSKKQHLVGRKKAMGTLSYHRIS